MLLKGYSTATNTENQLLLLQVELQQKGGNVCHLQHNMALFTHTYLCKHYVICLTVTAH